MSTRVPSRAAHASHNAEGGSPEVVVGSGAGVFLSPRVIDRRAYSEMSAELRDLVDRSASERASLAAALDQASRCAQDIRQREQSQNTNIELAARGLKTLDERLARVESLLARAEEQSAVFEQLESHAGSLIDAKINILEARLDAVQAAATAKTEALEERVRRASRELEQRIESIRSDAESIAGPAQQALSDVCKRAADLAGREPGMGGPPARNSLGDMVERAESLAGEVERVTKTLHDGSQRLEASRRIADEIDARQREIERQATELNAGLERSLEDVRTDVAAQHAALEGLTSRAKESLAEQQQIIERNAEIVRSRLAQQQMEMVSRAQTAIDQAQASLQALEARAAETRGQSDAVLSELRAMLQQAADAHSTTELAIKILSSTMDQARATTAKLEPWRSVFEGNGQLPEPIRRLIESVRGELRTELSSIAGALRSAAERAERVGRTIDAEPPASAPPTGNPLIAGRVSQAPVVESRAVWGPD
jgi:chromosome segregation ATPase